MHVGDHDWPPDAAGDGSRQQEHLVHRHADGRVVPEHRHRGRVTDEDDVDVGGFGQAGARGIVGRDHGDARAASLHADDIRRCRTSHPVARCR